MKSNIFVSILLIIIMVMLFVVKYNLYIEYQILNSSLKYSSDNLIKEKLEDTLFRNEMKLNDVKKINKEYAKYSYLSNELEHKNEELTKEIEDLNLKNEEEYKKLQQVRKEYYRQFNIDIIIRNIVAINQYPNYPNGCESIALLMLLRYYKVNILAEDIVNNLRKVRAPYYYNNIRYGGNPEDGFVGDPRLWSGWGVYEKPIIDVANKFKNGMIDITGAPLNQVLEKVFNGNPVQVWVSIDLANTSASNSWIDEKTGKTIYYPDGFHSLIVIGYNNNQVIVADSINGSIRYFNRARFEEVYNYFGKRAIYYEN